MSTWVTVTKRTVFVCVARAVVTRVVMTTVEMLAFVAVVSWQARAIIVVVTGHGTGGVVFADKKTGVEGVAEWS